MSLKLPRRRGQNTTFSIRQWLALVIAAPLLMTLISGCQNAEKKPVVSQAAPARGVAAVEQSEEQQEKEFQLLLNEQDIPGKLKYTYLERILRIYYRAELYVEEFERNLDEILAKKKADPTHKADPLGSVSYRKLTGMWMLSHRLKHDIEFYYRRLLETSKSEIVSEQTRERAIAALENMNQWIQNLDEEDKLQLIDLFRELDEVKKNFDSAANASGKSGRSVASATDVSTYAFMSTKDLEAKFKKHKAKIQKKAADSKNWKDSDADSDFSWIQFEDSERKPSAAAKIYPSAGPDGNVIGKVFPPNLFALTYDDGPGKATTPRLYAILKSHSDPINKNGAPASFFWLAKNVNALPGVVAEGKRLFPGSLNNHSWSHANLAKSSQAELNREIIESTNVQKRAYGSNFRFFRCPYGACFAPKVPVVRQMIADQGLIHAYWTVDSLDWKNIGQPSRTVDLVVKQMQANGRGVILFHDIHESSVDASKMLLEHIKTQNIRGAKIRLKTLEAAVDEVNK